MSIFIITFIASFFLEGIILWLLRGIGFYSIVQEGKAKVYYLFGKVVGVLQEPGIYFLWGRFGPLKAILVNWLGRSFEIDHRLDQEYLRSQPVNSEEGAPMGIGVWYEMYVSDPVAYLFRNTDPQGSLSASVNSAVVRCLSNLPLNEMLENRHSMSKTVREEVSSKSHEWGYNLGSVYIRKVHFRDREMLRQIEEKVVNRLRQVTASIRQDGDNQVKLLINAADAEAANEFGRAAAVRPKVLGEAFSELSQDKELMEVMFEVLEVQALEGANSEVILMPKNTEVLRDLIASSTTEPKV
jgi:regulator of protease activity HflC (stomatin/prohibitin superfamily)